MTILAIKVRQFQLEIDYLYKMILTITLVQEPTKQINQTLDRSLALQGDNNKKI